MKRMKLFIAEKPSLAQAIAAGIGVGKKFDGYISLNGGKEIVTWCYGHILIQLNPDEYAEKYRAWRMKDLPIIPSLWKLKVKAEKTRVVNIKRKYSEFLGFKIKVHSKGGKQVVTSHISDKQLKGKKKALVEQVKRIARPRPEEGQIGEIHQYNKMVMGIQNYYRIATNINLDAQKLNRAVITVITNRLKGISKKGRRLTPNEQRRYGKSTMLRYLADEPIYSVGYVHFKIPMNKSSRKENKIVDEIKLKLLRQSLYKRSIEYTNNRISLYSAQKGLCAVTGEKFTSTEEIHCHHKIPKSRGGTDEYQNLILVTATVHKLIHATNAETIQEYLQACKPNLKKLNVLRKLVGNTILSVD